MQKTYLLGPTSWKVMQRIVERYCELANKTTQQLYKVATTCIDDHHFWKENNGSFGQLSIVCSQIVLKMSVYGWHWETWYFMVCEQTCSCGHKMDISLRQTVGAFDLVHSSHKWVPTILLCGKHSTTMQNSIVSRLWFCRKPWRFKINMRRNSVHLRKSHVCNNKLDVQKNRLQFHTVLWKLQLFLSMQVYAWMWFPLSVFEN